jgi:CDP-diacylglycerol--glycerol-3-phosphate 3-phosphatidyltransferase
VARVLLAVPTLVLIAQRGASWPAVILWLVLACTDGVDGWIARRDGTTRSGAFLDPLADKILVIGGFVALGVRGDIGWIPILLVVGREAGIQVYRSLAGRRGISLPARQLGKWKTTLQFAAVGVFLFPPFEDMPWLQQTVLWVAVALTLLSALDMLRRGWQSAPREMRGAGDRDRAPARQIVDTNSSWIGEKLADAGIYSFEHRQVEDNIDRMVGALREILEESDAVIVCGGLGPTPDDMTRQAIADVMGVELERRDDLVEWVSALFTSRGRSMPENNLRQCDVPVGAEPIPNSVGTAPGIKAVVGDKIVYAVPGVPYEMHLMMSEHVLPDLLARSGQQSAIVSRSLKTWGTSESGLAEMIAHRVDAQKNPTIAFLARGIEGLVVRMTAKACRPEEAHPHRARGAGAARDPRRSVVVSTTRRWRRSSSTCCVSGA